MAAWLGERGEERAGVGCSQLFFPVVPLLSASLFAPFRPLRPLFSSTFALDSSANPLSALCSLLPQLLHVCHSSGSQPLFSCLSSLSIPALALSTQPRSFSELQPQLSQPFLSFC